MYWTFFFCSFLFCTDCGAKRAIWYQLLCVWTVENSLFWRLHQCPKRIEHSVNILNEVWNFFKSNVRANRERAYLNSEFGKFCKNFSIFENFFLIRKKFSEKTYFFFDFRKSTFSISKNFFRIDDTISRLSTLENFELIQSRNGLTHHTGKLHLGGHLI